MARRLILFVATAFVAVSCADDPSLDEESLLAGLPSVLVPEAPEVVADVDCPAPAEATVARSVVCTASILEEPITVDVDIDAEGLVVAEVRERLLDLRDVESVLVERLAADVAMIDEVSVTVVCPGTVVVDRPGVVFGCEGDVNGRVTELAVTIADDEGGWTVEFAAAGG